MTAVEWFYEQIKFTNKQTYNSLYKQYQQALEIEKQQILNAHLTGLIHPLEMEATKQAEQYYNDNFGDGV